MARHLPEIMEQTALDAKSQVADCPKCKGMGQIDGKGGVQDCPACAGKGTTYIMGDAERLKLVFETFGLSGKGGGVNVNLDLRKPPEPHEGLHDLAQSLGPILEGERK